MAGLKLVLVLLVCAAVVAPLAVESITCGTVASGLRPCLGYLRSGGPPQPLCCKGVRGLLSSAKTTPDRKSICNCLKTLVKSASINAGNAAKLPGVCGVRIPFPISASTNCNTIR